VMRSSTRLFTARRMLNVFFALLCILVLMFLAIGISLPFFLMGGAILVHYIVWVRRSKAVRPVSKRDVQRAEEDASALALHSVEDYEYICKATGRYFEGYGYFDQGAIALRTVREFCPQEPILDSGSGFGDILLAWHRSGVGIDLNRVKVRIAHHRKRLITSPAEFIVADVEKLPFRNGSFRFAVSLNVLEHLSNPGKAVAEIARVLQEESPLVLWTDSAYAPLQTYIVNPLILVDQLFQQYVLSVRGRRGQVNTIGSLTTHMFTPLARSMPSDKAHQLIIHEPFFLSEVKALLSEAGLTVTQVLGKSPSIGAIAHKGGAATSG
jgi:SAM-dependent methyltransferase